MNSSRFVPQDSRNRSAQFQRPQHRRKIRQAAYRLIADEAHALVEEQYELFNHDILPRLADEGICFLRRSAWTEAQRSGFTTISRRK